MIIRRWPLDAPHSTQEARWGSVGALALPHRPNVRNISAIRFAAGLAIQRRIGSGQAKATCPCLGRGRVFNDRLAIVGERPNQSNRPEEELANGNRRGIAMMTFPGDDTGQKKQEEPNHNHQQQHHKTGIRHKYSASRSLTALGLGERNRTRHYRAARSQDAPLLQL